MRLQTGELVPRSVTLMAYTSTWVPGPFMRLRPSLVKEVARGTDRLQLVLPQPAQLLLTESPFVQESPKHLREPRIATVVLAVDHLRRSIM